MQELVSLWSGGPRDLAAILALAGHEVRIVGGAVRDALRGNTPKDIDLVTDATPDEMLHIGRRLGLRTIPMLEEVERDPSERQRGGLKHGTVPFVINGETFEVTTLRVDIATDGRHAEVKFVRDFHLDAARRDFTINAMSVDAEGRLFDYFGGQSDLAVGRVAFVGVADDRIREDYLRILRYYRFRARTSLTGQNEDPITVQAIADGAHGLNRISGERIWQEMSRILADPGGIGQLNPMAKTGVCAQIGLGISGAGVDAARRAAEAKAHPAATLGLLVAHSGGSDMVSVRSRWKLGSSDSDIAYFATAHASMQNSPWSDFLDIAMEPRARRDHLSHLLVAFARQDEAVDIMAPLPEFPLRGADMIAEGVPVGPEVGAAMSRLRAAWKDSGYTASRENLLVQGFETGIIPRHPIDGRSFP